MWEALYVRVGKCIRVCLYVSLCLYVHLAVHICVCVYMSVRVRVCVCVCVLAWKHCQHRTGPSPEPLFRPGLGVYGGDISDYFSSLNFAVLPGLRCV